MTGLECIGGPCDGDVLADSGFKMYVALLSLPRWASVLPDGSESQSIAIRHGIYGKGTRWKRYGMRWLPVEECWVWEGEQ